VPEGLVLVDGVTGDVGDHFVEDNPEDGQASIRRKVQLRRGEQSL